MNSINEVELGITKINFDETFSFNDSIPKKYKNNIQLWTSIRDAYILETKKNKELYLDVLGNYTNLNNLKKEGITIMAENDQFSSLITKMASIISEQKKLHSNFLHYISQLSNDAFDTKTIVSVTTKSKRSYRRR
jgi:hypothetical protein